MRRRRLWSATSVGVQCRRSSIPGNREWARERAALERELTEAEYEFARSTTLNAHYTSPVVINAVYQALTQFGFEGGRILEPACGIGHFIGLMPEDVLHRSTITGIEIDPLTARIARALYPDADIRAQPFEQSKLADGFYDAAISNVPFGDYTVHDPRWNDYKFPIHDYFFAAALEKVRPGGLVVFITSRGTMDKIDSSLRELLSTRAELARRDPSPQRRIQAQRRHRGHHRHRDASETTTGRSANRPHMEANGRFQQRYGRRHSHQRVLRCPPTHDAWPDAAYPGDVPGQ